MIRHGTHFLPRLIIVNKTDCTDDALVSFIGERQVELVILSRPPSEGLIISISRLGSLLSGRTDSWVQVLAEDDLCLISNNFFFAPQPSDTMFLPDLAFTGNDNTLLRRSHQVFSALHPASLQPEEIEGDTSWHGVVREDLAVQYYQWLATLNRLPNVVSNVAVYLALTHGDVRRLPHFIFVKETSFYDSTEKVLEREMKSLETLFGHSGLEKHLEILCLFAAFSLISYKSGELSGGRFGDVRTLLLGRLSKCALRPKHGGAVLFDTLRPMYYDLTGAAKIITAAARQVGEGSRTVLRNFGLD